LSEKAIRAIFDRTRGKAKRDEDTGEGASNRSKKNKRSKQRSGDSLVAAAECKGKKASTEGAPDHFEKMLEGPFLNHAYSVKHAYKDYGLMKKFLARGSKKGDEKKKPDPQRTTPRRRTTMASHK
jgi:cell division protein YceG involved in septum cleavage